MKTGPVNTFAPPSLPPLKTFLHEFTWHNSDYNHDIDLLQHVDPQPTHHSGDRVLSRGTTRRSADRPRLLSSTYEREVAFAEETWRERLTGSGKTTFVAQAPGAGLREEGKDEDSGSGGYVGTVTVIAGRNVRANAIPQGTDAAKTYFVYGMWVRPEHRRRGVGRRLMERMLAWAGNDARENASGNTAGDVNSFEVWLAVRPADEPARKLYEELGFREIEGILEGHEELWMRRGSEEGLGREGYDLNVDLRT